jgi:hypothetical protein
MSEHGSSTPRNFVHRYAASLKLSASGPVDQDDLVRFEPLLPGFFHDVSFAASQLAFYHFRSGPGISG